MSKRFIVLAALVLCVGFLEAKGVEFINRAFTGDERTVFASGFQRYTRLRHDDGVVTRTSYNPTAAALGFYSTTGALEAGFTLSYERGTRKYGGDTGFRVRSEMPGMTVFTGFNGPDGFYLDQYTFLGYGTFKGRDLYDAGGDVWRRSGDIHKFQLATGFEVGKVFSSDGGWSIAPHAGFEFSRAPSEAYNFSRSDGPRLRYHSQNSYDVSAGLTLGKSLLVGDWKFTPSVDVTVVDSIGRRDAMNFHPGFAYRTSKEWRVGGVGGDHLGGRLRAGIDARLGLRHVLGLDYVYEKRDGYQEHRMSAVFGWSF